MTPSRVIAGTEISGRARKAAEALATIALAAPIAAALLAEMGMAAIDFAMAGHLGPTALAAAGLGASLLFAPQMLGMGVIGSVSAVCAQAHGAGDHALVGSAVRQGLRLGTLVSAPIVLALLLVPLCMPLTGYDPVITAEVQRILAWGAIGVPGFMWFTVLRNFVTALGRPMVVTVIAIAALPLTVIVNWLFMYGNLGMPRLGVASIGIASTAISWVQLIMLALYIERRRFLRAYEVFTNLLHHDSKVFSELFRVGWPIAIAFGFETGLFITVTYLVGYFGEESLAAHSVVINVCSISFMIPYAIGQAGTVRVGHAIGSGRPVDARRSAWTAVGLAALWMLCSASVMWFAPHLLVGIYLDLNDPANLATVAMAAGLFTIAAVFQLCDGIQVATGCVLRGYKDTTWPMAICGLGYWVIGLGSAIPLGFAFGLQAPGLWWGMAIGLIASASLLMMRLQRVSRRFIRIGA